jgi:hypothetical protein
MGILEVMMTGELWRHEPHTGYNIKSGPSYFDVEFCTRLGSDAQTVRAKIKIDAVVDEVD